MAATKKKALSPEAVRERIRGAGLRATPGRVATYAVLYASSSPLAHADVVEALTATGLDRATVYRNLTDLTEAGLVARTDLGDHTWRFELGGGHAAVHPHFICVDCGEVSCLEGVAVQITSSESAPRSVAGRELEVQLRGRCDDCS